jgi:hypothetical protein
MADKNRKRIRRPPKAAPAGAVAPGKVALDSRRVLPTQDWVAKVDQAQLNAVANIQKLAVSHFYTGLVNLRKDFAGQVLFPPDQNQLPRELHGTVSLPDGRPAASLSVSIQPFVDASNATVQFTQTGITDANGQFAIRNLPSAFVRSDSKLSLQFRGSNGNEIKQFAVSQIGSLGILGNVPLVLALAPLPQSIVGSLAGLVGSLDEELPTSPKPGTAENPISVKLGGGECPLQFDHDLPEERFRYSILVRLVEPRTSILTETIIFRGANDNVFFSALRNPAWAGIADRKSTRLNSSHETI